MDEDVAVALKDLRAEVATSSLETRAALATMRSDMATMRSDMATTRTELVTGLLENRASLAEHRLQTAEQFGVVNRKLDLLIDTLAAFRAEYNGHIHPDPSGA